MKLGKYPPKSVQTWCIPEQMLGVRIRGQGNDYI